MKHKELRQSAWQVGLAVVGGNSIAAALLRLCGRGAWPAVVVLQDRCYSKRRKEKLHGPGTWPKGDRERWHKDLSLDTVVEREKNVVNVIAMKEILASLPGMQMSMQKLSSYRKFMGLVGDRSRPAAWLDKYPTIFQVHEKGTAASWFSFTPEAAENVAREKEVWRQNEGILVEKVTKVLMMAPDRRISLDVLAQVKRDIGLPEDFKINLVHNHPDRFRVVETKHGAELELVKWDSALAVSAFEKMLASRAEDGGGTRPDGWVNWSSFKNKSNLRRKHVQEIVQFHQTPLSSPYSQRGLEFEPRSIEAERQAVAVLHELISLTLRKRVVVDRLAHYRRLFRYSKPSRAIFIQHPELFYVSLKNACETVFLRDAYTSSRLLVEDPFLEAQAWVASLIDDSKLAKRLAKTELRRERRRQAKAGGLLGGEDDSVYGETEAYLATGSSDEDRSSDSSEEDEGSESSEEGRLSDSDTESEDDSHVEHSRELR